MQKKNTTLWALVIGLLAFNAAQATEQPLTLEELTEIVKMQDAKIQDLEAGQRATVEAVEEGGANLPGWLTKTSLGGYGEVHYNNLKNDAGSGEKDSVDVHRFVLYFSHQYSDTVRFFSELELEHALSGGGDEAECDIPAGGAGGSISCDVNGCLLYTSPSPRDRNVSRMPSSA